MKLATHADGAKDGALLVVSKDLTHAVRANAALTLQDALDQWGDVAPELERQYSELNRGAARGASALSDFTLAAAMPRSYQFLDASAFLAHNHILADAWGFERRTEDDAPLMYQGLSDTFLPPSGEVAFRSIDDEIDFEAEFAVVLDETPLGVRPDAARAHIRLITMINDWSLRRFGPIEMQGGFGFLHAKPPCSMAAIAVTPDELGAAWRDAKVCARLHIRRNGEPFGHPDGAAMSYDFGRLIAHAATTRDLCTGTILGSGTVSNVDAASVGSGCIAERRALESLSKPPQPTPYLQFGERVRLEAFDANGRSLFGAIDQVVVRR